MSDKRRAVRVVPSRAITVAIEDHGVPRAYGVVANISETGACVLTNGAFRVGERLLLQLSFAREPVPLETVGDVVWSGATQDRGVLRYGLQWAEGAIPSREHLKTLISASVA
jgi:Tfp pilus assembly protein PilZ